MGKPQKIGIYTSKGNRGGYFLGYTKCEHCAIDLKILLNTTEMREFKDILGISRRKEKLKVKIAKKIQKWAEHVSMNEATGA